MTERTLLETVLGSELGVMLGMTPGAKLGTLILVGLKLDKGVGLGLLLGSTVTLGGTGT